MSPILWKAFFLCLALIAVFIIGDVLFFAGEESFKREGGGLENVSALLYGIAFVVFFAVAPSTIWSKLFYVPVLMLLFAFRELDFDKAFTESGILSLRLYSSDASLVTKFVSGAVACFSIFIILLTAWRGVPASLNAMRAGQLWPWFAVLAGFLVVATKSVDGLGRKLLDFGIVISDDLDTTASYVEEIGEAFIPVCAILAMVAAWKGSKG